MISRNPSPKKRRKRNERKSRRVSKSFFLQKAQETSASSVDETNNGSKGAKPREEKDKQVAIENNFGANKEYLTAFESFLKKDKSPKSKGPLSPSTLEAEKAKAEAKKSFVLLASTLHPKKVVREEMKAEEKKRKAEEKKRKEGEEKVKREAAEKKRIEEEERRGKKRKEREWEEQREREKEEQLRKERAERKKKEKEEKKRQEKENEVLDKDVQRKEQMSLDKRRPKVDLNKVKTDFEGKIPLPVSSPKKVGKLQDVPKADAKTDIPATPVSDVNNSSPNSKPSPEKDSSGDQIDVKTPKKLRKWPPENESPDPKKNFIKKHQEEQEKLHLESIANSPKPSLGPPTVPATPALAAPITKENQAPHSAQASKHEKGGEEPPRNVENSPFENLGYNSGDDVSRYSDDHLNKQLIVKPNTVLAKDGSEDEEKDKDVAKEGAAKPEPVLENNNKPPVAAAPPVTEQKSEPVPVNSDVVLTDVKPQEIDASNKTESERIEAPKMSDCMLEQQQNVNNSMEQ